MMLYYIHILACLLEPSDHAQDCGPRASWAPEAAQATKGQITYEGKSLMKGTTL